MSNGEIQSNLVLDAKGLACPMPIVRTKKAIETIAAGEVIEVQATDKGSKADIQGWARTTGHQYLGTIEEGDVLKHYIRKASGDEVKREMKFAATTTSEELQQKLENGASVEVTVLDVREPAEYAFERIAGAISIPLGELEERMQELNPVANIYVICRTGNRSDLACQLLAEKGFAYVRNVIPGMSGWKGATESSKQ